MAIIGIDLGTSNTLACVFQGGKPTLIPNQEGAFITPSVVSFTQKDVLLVGKAAKERLTSDPTQTAASYKVFMGSHHEIILGQQTFQPEELSSFVLRQIKEDAQRFLGEPVEEAVISVPAYFNDDQRCATKLAAELAGLKVTRLINEPSAAAVYYRWSASQAQDGKIMIVDFGGGTLDVSIVECFENIIEIQAIAGDNRLGGDDVDRVIAAHFCQQNGLDQNDLPPEQQAALLKLSRQAKQTLSEPGAELAVICLETAQGMYQMGLSQSLLAQLCEPLFQRVEKVLRQALANLKVARNIQQVVLIGGSSKMPVFQDFLQRITSARPIVVDDPDHIVALGAGICAGIKERREELQDLVMTDVCPFSLGVASYHSLTDEHPHLSVLIPRGSMLPVSRTDSFSTLSDGQEFLKFEIYQGESYFAAENLKLGELRIRVPRGPAGSGTVKITFTYDINGILHVEAISNSGQRKDTVILNPRLHLTPVQLDNAMEQIRQIKLENSSKEEHDLFRQALQLYGENDGDLHALLGSAINQYSMAQDSGDLIWMRKETHYLKQVIQEIQKSADPLDLFRKMMAQNEWEDSDCEEWEDEEDE